MLFFFCCFCFCRFSLFLLCLKTKKTCRESDRFFISFFIDIYTPRLLTIFYNLELRHHHDVEVVNVIRAFYFLMNNYAQIQH